MDVRQHNRLAWNKQVENGNPWTIPVPHEWFPALSGCDVLGLASGGGQQGPILAAAGANVTVLDNSPRQLAQDRLVVEREGLKIATVEGDIRDFADAESLSEDEKRRRAEAGEPLEFSHFL